MPGPPPDTRTLALVVEYDGAGFSGFQRQRAAPSVADELERALATLFGHVVRLEAAGRTDAGVHATGQVVSCTTTSSLPLRRLAPAASALLRDARIAVVRAAERPAGFSARRNALSRTYLYRILSRPAPSPLHYGRAFHVVRPLDVGGMRCAARALVGEHDFRAFAATVSGSARTVRRLLDVSIERREDFVELRVTADAFLHGMVRIMTGTLIEIGWAKRAAEDLERILRSRNRALAGFTAPPHGLYLEYVQYADPV